MNDEIELIARVRGVYETFGGCIKVPSLMYEAFEPLKTGDDPIMGIVSGEVYRESEEAKRIIKVREDAAKILADELAALIVSEMKKYDTHNGYKVKP